MSDQHISVGRKVLFVGGPDAGRVRLVPESAGDYLMGEGDYLYRVWTYKFKDYNTAVHFAYRSDAHPANLFVELWREYSPAMQIRHGIDRGKTYQTVRPKSAP